MEVQVMQRDTYQRNIFQRFLGICYTKKPVDEGCWTYENGKVIVDLSHAPELGRPDGAIRLEGKGIPDRLLVIHGEDGEYYAFKNHCTHGKRRLDPVPGAHNVKCCSIGKSTFGYDGKVISGSAKKKLTVYSVTVDEGKLIITI